MTSPNPEPSQPEPTADPNRPTDSDQAALFDAVAAEHAAIYGYGIVSAHIYPDENELVSRSVKVPLPATGYQLPTTVNNANEAAKLAIRMESDCAVAWRAVMEQATTEQDRAFGLTALTQCAVTTARWRQVLGAWPVTEAFPGGGE